MKENTAKVLIVDDEPNIVMTLDFLMRKNGFEVFLARDGAEALQIAQANVPNLVILDIMMPNVDGYEVCQRLRADPAFVGTKILFLSAKNKTAHQEKGLALGADAYMSKPFSTRELLKKVQELTAP